MVANTNCRQKNTQNEGNMMDCSYSMNIKNIYTHDFYDIDGFQNLLCLLKSTSLKPKAP